MANFLRIKKNQETVLSSLLLRLLASLEFPVPVLLVDSSSKLYLKEADCGGWKTEVLSVKNVPRGMYTPRLGVYTLSAIFRPIE